MIRKKFGGGRMLPKIGITCHPDYRSGKETVGKHYIKAVEKSGGIPLLLPSTAKKQIVRYHCSLVDGLILAGGVDVDPHYFGEQPIGTEEITPERDWYELYLTKELMLLNKPILAVCRGVQVLNIAAGGDIYQDIDTQVKGVIKHRQQAPMWYGTHNISVTGGSMLERILKTTEARVNSLHHQAARKVAAGFQISAVAVDGIIEAVESQEHLFVLGVQWHPERMICRCRHALLLFKTLVEKSVERRDGASC